MELVVWLWEVRSLKWLPFHPRVAAIINLQARLEVQEEHLAFRVV